MAVLQADVYKCEEVEEEPEPEIPVKPVICPKCGKKSPFDAVYCSNCSSILDEKRAIEMHEEKNAEEARLKKQIELKMEKHVESLVDQLVADIIKAIIKIATMC